MIRGACINWNYDELTGTLRSEDHGHPPVVVLEMNSLRERERECRFLHRTLSQSKRNRVPERDGSNIESRRCTCRDNHLIYSDTIGSLCARDYKGVGSQYVSESKLVIDIWN